MISWPREHRRADFALKLWRFWAIRRRVICGATPRRAWLSRTACGPDPGAIRSRGSRRRARNGVGLPDIRL